MKAFFKYQFKKSVIPFIVMAVCLAVMSLLQLPGSSIGYYEVCDCISYLVTVFAILCIVFPAWVYSYQMKKRGVDLFYSLPLSRTKQLFVRYVAGFATLLASYTVVYWIAAFIIAANVHGTLVYLTKLYFLLILPAWALYSISSYAFTRANSLLDGFVYIALFHFALFFVMVFLTTLFPLKGVSDKYFSFGPLIVITNDILDEMKYGADFGYKLFDDGAIEAESSSHRIAAMIIIGMIAVICTAALFLQEKYKKAENCNQISNGIIGYKTLLPLYIVCICTYFTENVCWDSSAWKTDDSFFTYVAGWFNVFACSIVDLCLVAGITAVAGYLCYALYTRSFKIGVKNAIVIAVCIAASLILGVTAYFV